MMILIKLLLNSKLDLIPTVKFVKQLFRIQIQKGGKVLLWNQVKSRMKACYSELVLATMGETELSYDVFLKFSLGPFEVNEVKLCSRWNFEILTSKTFILLWKDRS